MSKQDDRLPLTALRSFHAAGKLLSFQDAARELGVTPSAISHQIRNLEEWLGQPLFDRHPRRITLTAPGKALWRRTDKGFSGLEQALAATRQAGQIQRLKLSGLPLFVNAWLLPRLTGLEQAAPGISLQIETTNEVVDLGKGGVDLAIRNQRQPTPGLKAHKLLDIRAVPLCLPSLAEGKRPLKSPADLVHHTLIHVAARPNSWAAWLAQAGVPGLKPKRHLSFDDLNLAIEAAVRGHGIMLAPAPLIYAAPAASPLTDPFGIKVPSEYSYFLVYRREDAARPAIAKAVAWMLAEMSDFRRQSPVNRGRAAIR